MCFSPSGIASIVCFARSLAVGCWLQVITSRMRYISSTLEESGSAPMRIVGLCTSLANAKDLGEWIGATSHGLFNFPPGPHPVAVFAS